MSNTPAVPNIPNLSQRINVNPQVRIASPDIFIRPTSAEVLDKTLRQASLAFESLVGQELISLARHDIVGGQEVIYSPIKNLNRVAAKNNSKNMVPIQNTIDLYFKNFSIDLAQRIPEVGSGPDGEFIYLDSDTGNLTIDIINLEANEQVDVQVLQKGTVLDDTIYE